MTETQTVSRLPLALVALGALAITIATFLPFEESPSWRGIEKNTLIQHDGWLLVVFALAAAVQAYRVSEQNSTNWWMPVISLAAAALYLVITANSSRTLYPVSPDGQIDTSAPGVTASLGIAIYVAGLGVAIALIGAINLRETVRRRGTAPPTQKPCTDCRRSRPRCGPHRASRARLWLAAPGAGGEKAPPPGPLPPALAVKGL